MIPNKEKTIEFKTTVQKICATNETCFVLLKDGSTIRHDFLDSEMIEVCAKESINDIACCNEALFMITNSYKVVEITGRIQRVVYEFPRHQRITKIVSGLEHILLLTSNGEVFSFGCGLRGALGHGDVNPCEAPKQIEGLAGLKMIDIDAGSFHSIAVSSFGDVYSWGWNANGQLGLPIVAKKSFKKASESHQQVFTIPQLIELEDDDEAIKNVHCGSRHTIIRTEKNRLFVTGLNNYGQLGICSQIDEIDKFTEMPLKDVIDATIICCGFWSTYLIDFI